jgi:hypothetical protein
LVFCGENYRVYEAQHMYLCTIHLLVSACVLILFSNGSKPESLLICFGTIYISPSSRFPSQNTQFHATAPAHYPALHHQVRYSTAASIAPALLVKHLNLKCEKHMCMHFALSIWSVEYTKKLDYRYIVSFFQEHAMYVLY